MNIAAKRTLVLAVGALALLGAGAVGRRSAFVPSQPARVEALAVETAPSVAISAPSFSRPESDRALVVARLLAEVHAARSGRPRADQNELSASKERQARSEGERLADSLRDAPAAWNDVFDLLSCFEPTEAAVQTARLLQGAVDAAAERRLAIVLRGGSSSSVRRVALALVGRRPSDDVLSGVLAALQDSDPQLRLEALEIVAERRAAQGSPTSEALVEGALRRQVETDPDRTLRNAAHGLLGETMASPAPTSSRRAGLSSRSMGSRSRSGAASSSP